MDFKMKNKNIVKYFASSVIMLLLIVLSNKAFADTATVSTDTLNLRSKTSTSSDIIELLNSGDKLEILSEEGNWYKVKHNNNEGYVSKDYVKVTKTATTTTTTTSENNNDNKNNQTTNNNQQTSTVIKLKNDSSVRITPLINSNVISNLKSGTEVTVITKTNKWTFIETNEISGWVVSTVLSEETKATTEETNTGDSNKENSENDSQNDTKNTDDKNNEDTTNDASKPDNTETKYTSNKTMYVKGTSVYVRNEASTSASIVITLIQNTDVVVTGESGDWYKVKYNNYEGYIYKDLLSESKVETTNRSNVERTTSITPIINEEEQEEKKDEETVTNSSKGEEIVAYAKQYLGCPYVYGASGSSSFDCSGFTMYIYKHFGYSLSHSATAQSRVGTAVSKENLQPGDLVFFLDYETMDGIGHCGIYIGDGNFIHASSGSGYCVKISTLTSGSYLRRYASARRLI